MKQGNSISWQKHKYINYVLKVRVCFYIALNNLFSHITALERLGNAASWKKKKKKKKKKKQKKKKKKNFNCKWQALKNAEPSSLLFLFFFLKITFPTSLRF